MKDWALAGLQRSEWCFLFPHAAPCHLYRNREKGVPTPFPDSSTPASVQQSHSDTNCPSQRTLHKPGPQPHEAVLAAQTTRSGVPRAQGLCWPAAKQSSQDLSGCITLPVPQPRSSVNLIVQKILSRLHYIGTSESVIVSW